MLRAIKLSWTIAATAIMLSMSFITNAGLLLDGEFENPPPSSPWNLYGNAFFETSPATLVQGSQALKLFGNFGNPAVTEYTVASQEVAIDGTDFSVGDDIVLSGLIGHLSNDALVGSNQAYIEIAFVNDLGAIDFGNAIQSIIFDSTFATDVFHALATTKVKIPSMVFGSNVQSIRVAAAFYQPVDTDVGAAWFDNLTLTTVPEPGSIALLCLGLAGLGCARRKKLD